MRSKPKLGAGIGLCHTFHNTIDLPGTPKEAKLLNSQTWRRKVPGGAAGLQNQSGGRKAPGGFDSLPSPPIRKAHGAKRL